MRIYSADDTVMAPFDFFPRLAGFVVLCLFAGTLVVVASAAATTKPTPFEIADKLDLVPTPRQIALSGERFNLKGWKIVTVPGNTLFATGAAEINDRVEKLGGKPLEVSAKMVDGNCILAVSCTHPLAAPFADQLDVRPDSPGEQGYAIAMVNQNGRRILLAIGCDDLGTLYACITLRRLIQPDANGPVLLSAKVRDWPVFKRRCLGNIGRTFRGNLVTRPGEKAADAIFRECKPYIQWLARHKINMTVIHLPRSFGDAATKELMAYGRRYGLKYRYLYGTSINAELEETGNPWTECVTRQDARHCWTADQEHRLKARKIAERVREMGYDNVVHHVTDSGGLPDPETWSNRCQRCRDRYGDDQPRAVADQLKLYHDTIKQLNPDVLFEAVLQPYHFQWVKEGFCDNPMAEAEDMPHAGHTRGLDDPEKCRQVVARATAIHQAVAAALPPEAMVTFREAGRAEFGFGRGTRWTSGSITGATRLGRVVGSRKFVSRRRGSARVLPICSIMRRSAR